MYANTVTSASGGLDRHGLAAEPTAAGPRLATRRPANSSPAARRIASSEVADACYFRSRAAPGQRKALVQITERCDLRCAHCFVSATQHGSDIKLDQLTTDVIERLLAARVANVTLTGGEPFVHPDLMAVVELLTSRRLDVTVCTNACRSRRNRSTNWCASDTCA
jgi:uncharacterized radical SAM superfamily Fe-S cluster-containing enzyme